MKDEGKTKGQLINELVERRRRIAELEAAEDERKRAEEESRLLQTLTVAISEAKGLHSALGVVLHEVCEATGWVFGEAWIPNPEGTQLELSPAWHSSVDGLESFRTLSEGFTFPLDVGLPGRAWSSKQPVWMRDVTAEEAFLRAAIARDVGLKAGMAIPVIADDEVVSVMVFFVPEARGEDERLLGLVSAVAAQVGSVVQRKRAEEELRQHRDHLEELVEERTTELHAVNAELEAFNYSVSHDLRAPLRGIDGFSQVLLEDYQDELDQQGKDYLQRVRAASQRMGHMIDDLLNLSRVTRGELRREPVNLSAIAKTVIAELQQADPDRQVEFVVTEGLTASGDGRLLHLVLENLLGNAWKFSGRNSHSTIEFGATENNGQTAFFVRDDGVGFNMAYADKLFGAFQRLYAGREFEGAGIGLATVQRIIHRHGGRVWAEAAVDQGATFYFTV